MLSHETRGITMATAIAEPPEQPEDTAEHCYHCGQFRLCALVKEQWYCKTNCEVKARRGTLSHRNRGEAPRRGR